MTGFKQTEEQRTGVREQPSKGDTSQDGKKDCFDTEYGALGNGLSGTQSKRYSRRR
jgi:hypothetical protein